MSVLAYDLIIFDCDGVLADNEHLASSADQAVLAQYGVSLLPAVVGQRYAGLSYADMIASVNSEFGTTISPRIFEKEATAKLEHKLSTELRAMSGIAQVIGEIVVTKCVASSSSPDKLQRTLRLTDLEKFFGPHVFSTALVPRGKPAPDIILYACDKLTTDPARALVIEDSIHGIRAALAAGAAVIGFVGGSHCGLGAAQSLREAGADMIARDTPQLRALLYSLGICGDLECKER